MSAAVAPRPQIGERERLSATLVLSLLLHGMLLLGLGFALEDAAPVMPTLDVILTQTSTALTPKQADFLAQASNQGGGESDKAQRPREPQFADVPKPDPGMAPEPMTAQAPPPAPDYQERLLTTVGRTELRTPAPEDRDHPPTPLPTGDELVRQSMEMARLAAELDRQREAYARRPKTKRISASTQEFEGSVGKDHAEHQAEDPSGAVVRIDQQRAEAGEQRHPGGQKHRHRDVAQVILRRVVEALTDQPPDHADHDGAGVGAQHPGRPERPAQPQHGLAADQ